MSHHRLANSKVVTSEVLRARRKPARSVIEDTVTDLLAEIEREAGAGDEVMWDTLQMTVEPERKVVDGLRFRAEVVVDRNDVVGALSAVALAMHERSKGRP